jgi:hypothetical protein
VRPHFQPARMGLEGLVSKLRDSRYRAGPSRDWIKVKNPTSSAMSRAEDLASQCCVWARRHRLEVDLKDIDSNRAWIINKDHLPKLIELGLVEVREGTPYLTTAGQTTAWQK